MTPCAPAAPRARPAALSRPPTRPLPYPSVQDKFLKDPSLRAGDSTLFMASPAVLRQATEENLGKPLAELIEFGTEVAVTDETLGNSLALMVTFEE